MPKYINRDREAILAARQFAIDSLDKKSEQVVQYIQEQHLVLQHLQQTKVDFRANSNLLEMELQRNIENNIRKYQTLLVQISEIKENDLNNIVKQFLRHKKDTLGKSKIVEALELRISNTHENMMTMLTPKAKKKYDGVLPEIRKNLIKAKAEIKNIVSKNSKLPLEVQARNLLNILTIMHSTNIPNYSNMGTKQLIADHTYNLGEKLGDLETAKMQRGNVKSFFVWLLPKSFGEWVEENERNHLANACKEAADFAMQNYVGFDYMSKNKETYLKDWKKMTDQFKTPASSTKMMMTKVKTPAPLHAAATKPLTASLEPVKKMLQKPVQTHLPHTLKKYTAPTTASKKPTSKITYTKR